VVGGSNTTGWPDAPAGKRRQLARIGPALLVIALVGFQLWAMAGYRDDWPFAANAMFAFPRVNSEPVYELSVVVEVEGAWRPLDPRTDLGLAHPEYFRRVFFSRYYGSTNGRFPQRTFSSDDRTRFEARLTEFCRAIERSLADNGESATALRLELVEHHRRDGTWFAARREVVGRCDPIESPFRSEQP
jgi:hypothetical protein